MSCIYNGCDCQDENYDDSEVEEAPKVLTWRDVEPANEVQAKAWGDIINDLYEEFKVKALNLPAAIAVVCQKVQVRSENYASLSLQIERFIRESPAFELRKGKNGGMFRTEGSQPVASIKLVKMLGVPDMITGKVEDNYTCGCGNTKCNTTEKSCWKCGAAIKP